MAGDRKDLIRDIIAHEWAMFDGVDNIGGRAACQDDWHTFNIMRNAQFLNWPDSLLESYFEDLLDAESVSRNMVAEKYGYMMESTSPEEYEDIRELLPVRSEERLARQEAVIAVEMAMDDDFCRKYPEYSKGSRKSRTSEDTPYFTSKETYMRGEMSTWSDRTFGLYEAWAGKVASEGKSVPEMIAENIVKGYGYPSLAQVEEMLRK